MLLDNYDSFTYNLAQYLGELGSTIEVHRNDKISVEQIARLKPEDIDVVHPGLSADVHLLPYNQRRVPRLTGTVMHVSADRLLDKRTDQPYYATKIRVQDSKIVENGLKEYDRGF